MELMHSNFPNIQTGVGHNHMSVTYKILTESKCTLNLSGPILLAAVLPTSEILQHENQSLSTPLGLMYFPNICRH